ncbi:SDR family NAD(P)-dependent oxidoreductase [Miltoncostaea marina]|uniref:SDR family NAD(P)-dependent oxidoreductase n=1 Tax=Miltoncostaea marina TaxID=2843215 RepID=UPI001C3C8A0E
MLAVDVVAPVALLRLVLPLLERRGGRVIDVSSDAAVEPYPGWGGEGASKAALDQATAVLAVEHPGLRVHALEPGDMRTDMHQAAFPGEGVSDRPPPQDVVPAVMRLVGGDLPSGRHTAAALLRRGRGVSAARAPAPSCRSTWRPTSTTGGGCRAAEPHPDRRWLRAGCGRRASRRRPHRSPTSRATAGRSATGTSCAG